MTLEILTSDALAPLRHGFFTRKGGASSGVFHGLNCGTGSSDPAQFVEEDARDTLIRRFFALGSINQSGPSGVASASAALTLLQSAPVPPLT